MPVVTYNGEVNCRGGSARAALSAQRALGGHKASQDEIRRQMHQYFVGFDGNCHFTLRLGSCCPAISLSTK